MSRLFSASYAKPASDYSVRELVDAYRVAGAKERTIIRNRRLGLYQGRNRTITDDTLFDARTSRHAIEFELVHRSPRTRILVGWLVAEHNLSARISESRDVGAGPRPELKTRLNATRALIRAEVLAQ